MNQIQIEMWTEATIKARRVAEIMVRAAGCIEKNQFSDALDLLKYAKILAKPVNAIVAALDWQLRNESTPPHSAGTGP
jgi:hypothetical protein